MTSADAESGAAPELIGYASRFSVAPGEPLSFMVSGETEHAEAALVRLVHGDARSPIGLVEQQLPSTLDGVWSVERQVVHPGSFGVVDPGPALAAAASQLSGHLFVQPTLVERATAQGLLAHVAAGGAPIWDLAVERGGDLVLRAFADGAPCGAVRLEGALCDGVWHAVAFAIDARERRAALWTTPLAGVRAATTLHAVGRLAELDATAVDGRVLLGARRLVERPGEPRAAETFNGKLERPTLFAGVLDADACGLLAGGLDPERLPLARVLDLDLGAESDGWHVWDRVASARAGRLCNAPLRRVTSHRWAGETLTPVVAPASYAAVRFHDDDVHHADWRPTRDWTVPADLASGLYAVRLRGGGVEDRIPFVVRPPRDRATHPVALWLPTFTYAAYANARSLPGTAYGDFVPERPPGDEQLARHPEWGGSTYDRHPDGTGVAISSLARPVPNLRPTYRAPLVNGPRHLAADLYLVHWLEHLGVSADVFGDEDVHADGAELLARYRTVVTGTHPEYVTSRELDAIEAYAEGGGRLMYMGGNGFYWVTSVEPEAAATTVEVRRGHAGTRSWDAVPGEQHHQLTGEPGGLWRHRGRPPHALVGVGFVAEGRDGRNPPYRRAPDSFEPAGAWAFAGIGDDEPIGAGGYVMGGAAGDELDSADRERGTPAETLVLASSCGHSDAYWHVVEDLLWNEAGLSGTRDARVRADVTLTPRRNGGAVFAVGSMSWAGSLSWRGYDNAAARLSANVLRAFAAGETPWLGGDDDLVAAGPSQGFT